MLLYCLGDPSIIYLMVRVTFTHSESTLTQDIIDNILLRRHVDVVTSSTLESAITVALSYDT